MRVSDIVQEIVAGLIAIITVVGALAITAFQLVHSLPTAVPEWITLLIGAIVGAYFARAASQNGARQAGTAAAQTAIDASRLTNGGSGSAASSSAVH